VTIASTKKSFRATKEKAEETSAVGDKDRSEEKKELKEEIKENKAREFPLPRWLADAKPFGDGALGWHESSWFGTFHKSRSDWLYHTQLGWIFPMDDEAGNGWLWTGEGLFRYLLRHRDQQWLYYLLRRGGRTYYFNYTTSSLDGVDRPKKAGDEKQSGKTNPAGDKDSTEDNAKQTLESKNSTEEKGTGNEEKSGDTDAEESGKTTSDKETKGKAEESKTDSTESKGENTQIAEEPKSSSSDKATENEPASPEETHTGTTDRTETKTPDGNEHKETEEPAQGKEKDSDASKETEEGVPLESKAK